MSLHEMRGLTPHLREPDLEALEGHTVFGEPLPLLVSAALRLRQVSVRGGITRFAATMTTEESDALMRAIARVEVPAPISTGDDDGVRAMAVLVQACRAADRVVAQILARPA